MQSAFDQVFIVTYGRSGSTVLQRILNSIDGYLIKGENNAALLQLFRSVKAVTDGQAQIHPKRPDGSLPSSSSPSHPWFGIHDIDVDPYARTLVDAFVQHVIAPGDDVRVYGFKEIRYLGQPRQLPAFLDFMRTTFSNPAFIFNYRRWENVTQSRWWKSQDPEELKGRLRRFEETASEFCTSHRDRCIELQYENYATDAAALKPLFDFLGEEFCYDLVERIMSQPLMH